jgi:hypothetical protein
LSKRNSKSQDITNNSGTFISLKTSYHPDWFVISNYEDDIISDISFIPTWGIRRNIGTILIMKPELASAIDIFSQRMRDIIVMKVKQQNLHVRIGYVF